nr:dihydropteroate synthase [Rhodospirillum rubrum]
MPDVMLDHTSGPGSDSPVPTIGSPALPRGFFHAEGASPAGRLYLQPVGLLDGQAAAQAVVEGLALPLAGRADHAFCLIAALLRGAAGDVILRCLVSPAALRQWAASEGAGIAAEVEAVLARLSAPRPPFAGLPLGRGNALVMGILNVTPDSFSDGGDHVGFDAALAGGQAMLAAGAAILDVGGESTRPGAAPVDPQDEIARVVPVIRAFAERGAVVSVDTRNASTMEAALAAGARIVNDVTALTGDERALGVVARARAPVILMHIRGEPRTMQSDPSYASAPLDVVDWLAERLACCRAAGMDDGDLCVDPGIGFGKTVDHNLEVLEATTLLHGLGVGVLIGASRKSFIGRVADVGTPKARLPGSLAAALAAARRGADIVRVHDVGETVQALRVAAAIESA